MCVNLTSHAQPRTFFRSRDGCAMYVAGVLGPEAGQTYVDGVYALHTYLRRYAHVCTV